MSWKDLIAKIKKEELPPEFKDKDPAVLGAELESRLSGSEAALRAKDTELANTKARLAQLEGGGKQEQVSVLDDEDRAFNQRLAPVMVAQLQTNAMLAKMQAIDRLRADPDMRFVLEKYGNEVEEHFSRIPLQFQGSSEAFLNAFKIVMANHVKELVDQAKKTNGSMFVESVGPGNQQQTQDDKKTLSEEELAVAKKLGVSPERFLKSKNEFKFVRPTHA